MVHTAFDLHEGALASVRQDPDPKVVLDSFIVSNTPSHEMKKQWGLDKLAMQQRHIVFQEEDRDSYVRAILEAAGPLP